MSSQPRGPQPLHLQVTTRQDSVLKQIVQSPKSPQGLVQRTQIIIQANAGRRNQQIALALEVDVKTVRKWRNRWHKAEARLRVIEEEGTNESQLPAAMLEILTDRPRSGAPAKFTAEQVCQIVAVSCEAPEESARPVTHWTPQELADEVVQRSIVDSISPRQVGRFLKGGGSQTASFPILAQ